MASLDAEVAVVGAGPVGAVTALFAASGSRVVIVDQAHFPRDKPCGEGLLPPGRAILARLGIEGAVRDAGAPTLRGIAFGLLGRPQVSVHFPPHPDGAEGLGVRRLRFDAFLVERLQQNPNVAFHPGVMVSKIRLDGDAPALVTSDGEIRARFIAVADGLRSGLRHQLGWTIGPRGPHRYAVVGHWRDDRRLDPWVRITADQGMEAYDGPVGPHERLIALLCTHDRMKEFAGRLNQRYRELVAGFRPEAGVPLDTAVAVGPFNYRASTVARGGIFLVGDASGFVDPISGEGLATGMQQGLAFSQAIRQPDPESSYRRRHRRLTAGPRRATTLLVHLATSPRRADRAVRGMQRAPGVMPKLLGMTLGYWGAGRLTPRDWLALLTGR